MEECIMTKAIRIYETGGPDVMRWKETKGQNIS
jgi:hypothetical protein